MGSHSLSLAHSPISKFSPHYTRVGCTSRTLFLGKLNHTSHSESESWTTSLSQQNLLNSFYVSCCCHSSSLAASSYFSVPLSLHACELSSWTWPQSRACIWGPGNRHNYIKGSHPFSHSLLPPSCSACGDDSLCDQMDAMPLKGALKGTCEMFAIILLLINYGIVLIQITKGAGHRWLQSVPRAYIAAANATHLPKKIYQEETLFTKEQKSWSRSSLGKSDSVTGLAGYPTASVDGNKKQLLEQYPSKVQSDHNSFHLFNDGAHDYIDNNLRGYEPKGRFSLKRSLPQEAIFFVSNIKELECISTNSPNVGNGLVYDASKVEFEVWLEALKEEAINRGVSKRILEGALRGIKPSLKILERDSNQPEMQLSAKAYLERMINDYRITKGVWALQDNKILLQEISAKYGIPTTILVAVWGIESSYGAFLGSWDVIEALVTLASQSQKISRANYFKEELIQALLLLEEGQIYDGDTRLKGSWAGAMGQCQFMPSSLRQYGVDYDEDGRKDIWQSHADIFASMANYLHVHGWKVESLLAYKVFVPENIDKNVVGLKVKKTIREWKYDHNVHGLDEPFEQLPIEMVSLVAPEGPSGATYLVGDNFRALMRYNASSLYCLAVYELSNEILKRVG